MSNIAASRVQTFMPPAQKRKKPVDGEKIAFAGLNSTVAFSVVFKGSKVVIERMDNGEPDVTRQINPTFGNRRTIDSQLYETADAIRDFLWNLKEDATR